MRGPGHCCSVGTAAKKSRGRRGCKGAPKKRNVDRVGGTEGARGFPAHFLTWLDVPIEEAFAALRAVPLCLDRHRQWCEVARALRNLRVTVQGLRKLASWLDDGRVHEDTSRKWHYSTIQRRKR